MKIIGIAIYFAGAVMGLAQQSINFLSPVPADGTYSTSTAWDTEGGFKFEVGAFTVGFTPTALNTDLWSSNWTVANHDATGLATWIDDGGDTGFSGAGTITSLSAPFEANAPLYIWGYDSKVASSCEWILLSDTSWVVASNISSPLSSDFITDGTTSAIVGSINNSGATFQSALVTIAPIPEPSTYAAIAGAGMFGFALLRKRRKVA